MRLSATRPGMHSSPWQRSSIASFDLDILNAPTRLERESIEKRLISDPEIQRAFDGLRCRVRVSQAGDRPML